MINVDELGARIIIGFGDGKIFISESILYGLIVAAVLAVLGIWMGLFLLNQQETMRYFGELDESEMVGDVKVAYRFGEKNRLHFGATYKRRILPQGQDSPLNGPVYLHERVRGNFFRQALRRCRRLCGLWCWVFRCV